MHVGIHYHANVVLECLTTGLHREATGQARDSILAGAAMKLWSLLRQDSVLCLGTVFILHAARKATSACVTLMAKAYRRAR